jgi:hypothetical protein
MSAQLTLSGAKQTWPGHREIDVMTPSHHRTGAVRVTGIYGMSLTSLVDLQPERFDNRCPKSNIGCE